MSRSLWVSGIVDGDIIQRDLFAQIDAGITAYRCAGAGIEFRMDIAVNGIGHRTFISTQVSFCLHDADIVDRFDCQRSQVQFDCGICVIQDAYISSSRVDVRVQ